MHLPSKRPVFFDPNNKRWPKVKAGALLAAVLVSAVLVALVVSVLVNPALESLSLPAARFLPRPNHLSPPLPVETPAAADARLAKLKRTLAKEIKANRHSPPVARNAPTQPYATKAIGFFVNWDDASLSSLKKHIGNLDILIPEWLHMVDGDGTIREDSPDKTREALRFIRSSRPDLPIMPLVNNFIDMTWRGDLLARMAASSEARARVVAALLDFVRKNGFAGVSLDFEDVPPKAQKNYLRFVTELSTAFHNEKLAVSINVPAEDPAFPYRAIAEQVDQVIIMAYDEHWAAGKPGPIASLPWYVKALRPRMADIPAGKLVVALGSYAYDWPKGKPAEEVTFEEAVLLAKESESAISLDPVSLNPHFDYDDEKDVPHNVWLMDATTVLNAMASALPLQPAGFALWRLGGEDPSIWTFFGTDWAPGAEAAARLEEIRFDYDLDYEGQGEILRIAQTPHIGRRSITYDGKSRLITGESFEVYPSPYVIERHGFTPKTVALTFDDGPDPKYTPRILDILRQTGAAATFFVIGSNAERNPELLRRTYAEGHDIGNHTYTHPNIADVSTTQLTLEVSATQRLFESVLGHRTHLFRSPYGEDSEPETQDQVRPLEILGKQGYVFVGMNIDPNDWRQPGVDAIVEETVRQVEIGEGNIILLHDGGGDRAQTVAALPRIIEILRGKGYQFATVSELLGQTRDTIMPEAKNENPLVALGTRIGFFLLFAWSAGLQYLFILGTALGLGRLAILVTLAVAEKVRGRHKPVSDQADKLSVAVVVPAYNEEKVVLQTVQSLLACQHPAAFEIIVVDDGSSDNTYAVVREAFAGNALVTVVTQPNGGKPSALNHGIGRTKADIVVTLDADTVFTRDTIMRLVAWFADPKVGAVAGNAKVGNRINFLTRCQALEYVTSQNLDRRALTILDSVTVVPGAVGAWRREVVEAAGGFSAETLAEDADLTIRIQRMGFVVAYEDRAVALTEAPDTMRGFLRQRFRWMFGTLQVAWKHKDALFRPRYGLLGFCGLPNIWIYQIFFQLISPIMDLWLAYTCLVSAVMWMWHPASWDPDSFQKVVFYYALFMAADILAGLVAFFLERSEDKLLLVWLVPQRFFYRQLMYVVALQTFVASLRGREMGWAKLERKATVDSRRFTDT
ncbi:glycosyltransferase [Desulfovibrio sp. TomC]|uniref:glycosyltransferase n=1 Tax=Desulfovibrio sp. TomC TaxID=1562888 RepID=UPI000574CDC6|nr:glycosyltransferase [Desulfovibrio sp. TomC]KHK03531.1 Glycosyltransferase [Desulfovibrio sp. TomC]